MIREHGAKKLASRAEWCVFTKSRGRSLARRSCEVDTELSTSYFQNVGADSIHAETAEFTD